MAFVKRTWLARIGTGLNKFLIGEKDANDKQTLVNSPDSVTQQGDVISAENLNDLEDRIDTAMGSKADMTYVNGMKLTKVWENPDSSTNMGSSSIDSEDLIGVNDVVIAYRSNSAGYVEYARASNMINGGIYGLYLKRIAMVPNSITIWSRFVQIFPQIGRVNVNTGYEGTITTSGAITVSEMTDDLILVAIYAVGDIYNS